MFVNDIPPAPRLIGIAGRAGAGKSTVAAYLEDEHSFEELAFADPLVNMLHTLFDTADVPSKYITERALKEEPTPLGPSYRRLMQTLGTEWGRDTVALDFWVGIARRRLDVRFLHGQSVVFSDLRFPNEVHFIKQHGGHTIRVQREDLPHVNPHVSESQIDGHAMDFEIFNNGSKATLFDQVDRVMAAIRS
jgi:hypothetical protein